MAVSTAIILGICASLLNICNTAVVHRPRQSHSPQQIVDKWIAVLPGGAVAAAIVTPSETEYFFGGKLSPDNQGLPNDQTIYEVGSITKGFTGLLLADQVLSGNVFLNDTLSKLLTDWPGRFKSQVGNVTLLELTTHTAGLPNMPENMDDDYYVVYTKKDLYQWLDTVKPVNRGSYNYSNGGVAVLGEALAVTAGKPYETFVKERVLIPLGLLDATLTLTSEQERRLAPGHGFDGRILKNWPLEALAPAGAMKFSIKELVNFLTFTTGLREGSKRMDEALEMSTSQWGVTTGTGTIGLGWMRLLLPQDQLLVWHNGATLGYNAFVGWVPERQIGVAVLISLNIYYLNNTCDILALQLLNEVLN